MRNVEPAAGTELSVQSSVKLNVSRSVGPLAALKVAGFSEFLQLDGGADRAVAAGPRGELDIRVQDVDALEALEVEIREAQTDVAAAIAQFHVGLGQVDRAGIGVLVGVVAARDDRLAQLAAATGAAATGPGAPSMKAEFAAPLPGLFPL